MTERWSVHDGFFPFVCENEDCRKAFERHEIMSAAESGYVRLTNEEFTFVGLTCPSCQKTTIRKYSQDAVEPIGPFFFVQESFAPFTVDGSLILKTDDRQVPYFVPENIPRLIGMNGYPAWLENQCLCEFGETDIGTIIEWENQHRKKILPRIVGPSSVYHKTDCFLSYLKEADSPADNFVTGSVGAEGLNQALLRIAKDHYLSGVKTTITAEEYKDLAIDYLMAPDYWQDFIEICSEMLKEYAQKRNDIDFDLTWKTDFLDKYLRRIFYRKGYYKSKLYYQDKWEYEEIMGKVFKGPFPRIDESQVSEIMSCQEVINQLGIEPILLTGFIVNGDLPAYYADWVYFDPRCQAAHNTYIDPEKFIYLSSEVDELIMKHPRFVKKGQEAVGDEVASPEDKKATEHARLLFEEFQWDASINAAVQFGLDCADGKTIYGSEDLIKRVDEIAPGVPVSTIETIWDALPQDPKRGDGKIESSQLVRRKNGEYREHYSDTLTAGEQRNLKQRRDKGTKRISSIKAAFQIAMDLQKAGKKIKREDLESKLYEFDGNLTSESIKRVIKLIPSEFRLGPGNPRNKKEGMK